MKTYKIIMLLCMALFLHSCVKIDLPEGTPDCVKGIARDILKDEVRNPPAAISLLTYNGKDYYYVPPYCCDAFSELYDEDCNLICAPDGGFTGSGDRNCPAFIDSLVFVDIIWEDTRTE